MMLGLGAPGGWLLWRVARYGVAPYAEVTSNIDLYMYLTVSTMFAFASFGIRLASAETRLRRENVDLSTMAITDGLTGLRNGRFFHARLEEAVEEGHRSGRPFSLVMLDLDHFKRINDTHGHPVGDQVLAAVAARLKGGVRGADTAARVGGEEFALLLIDTPLDAALHTAERVRRAIATEPFETSAGALNVTISAGVASGTTTAEALLEHADGALYRAKAAGRNQIASAAE